ncbi:sugar MFS transporter [Agromyces sp. S2-1-8]|uniref:MFS transporter n=1 Tax=Agromyces sp. S2-1-8 TaxID=2897180 RepID=UPI001E605235|nr:MFS transporter [Agromyces sp. S2-1-8]MCD5346090.1 MFS transporter [Agromyces sp. S2-1-8]
MPTVSRARWSLMAQFALFGFIQVSWMSRMPSIRTALDISALQLGSLLIIGGIGSLIGALTIGAIVARFGSRNVLVAGTVGNVVGFGLDAAGLTGWGLGFFVAGMFVNGLCGAFVNVPININAAAVEQRLGRAVLPQFHAAFSIGAAGGALIAGAFAFAEVHVATQVVVVTAAVTVLRALLITPSTAYTARQPVSTATGSVDAAATGARNRQAVRSALGAWLEPRTLLLGVVLLAASLAEGAATTWLTLAVVDGFASTEAIGAVAYGTFVGAMTVFRFVGTGLIDRFGRVAVLRASGVSSLVGLALFVFGPNLAIAWVGIVLWGCGTALGNPIAISAASDDPSRAGQRVSVVTSFSTISSLAAPPLLGLLADEVGARYALLAVGAVMILSLSVAGQVRRRPAEVTTAATTSTGSTAAVDA